MISEDEFAKFVEMFRRAFMTREDSWDFMETWKPSVIRFDFDVLQRAIISTAKDQRIITAPPRSRLPIIVDYAEEYQMTKTRFFEAKKRREDDAAWRAAAGNIKKTSERN